MNAEAKEFCRLCVEGMLFEVQAWLRDGRAVPLDADCDTPPMVLAAGKGFHSLVTILLGYGPSQEVLAMALERAGAGGNLEVCRLLIGCGAQVGSVKAKEVLKCGNPAVAEYLMAEGMDIENGFPLGKALVDRSAAALAFFRGWRRKNKKVRYQGAMALKHFVLEGMDYWATAMKRAGADPRLPVVALFPRSDFDGRYETSALYEAVHAGKFPIVLRMGVRKSDDFEDLRFAASWKMEVAIVRHLVERAGPINDRPDGSSSWFQWCVHAIGQRPDLPSRYDRTNNAWVLVEELAGAGAKWKPDGEMLRLVRYALRFVDLDKIISLAHLLLSHNVTSRETVTALFTTSAIKIRMGRDWKEFRNYLVRGGATPFQRAATR